jgi:(2S)-methylsuccinyl-CoA dehydrogenase
VTPSGSPSIDEASEAVELAQRLVDGACAAVRNGGGVDANQVVAYDVAHAAAGVATARAALAYGALGEIEQRLAVAFVADVLADLVGRVAGREAAWGTQIDWIAPAADFLRVGRDPATLAALANVEGPRHLGSDFELVRETFHRFAEDKVRPHAEHVHRTNGDIPEEIISGLAELGGFGLSVPEEYDGFATGGESDYLGMVVATEELSWGSLGIGGSLITRPEILTRALVYGGTEAQKKQWLPKLASAEVLAAVAVTEPDFGSDVAGIVTSATPAEGGWLINGVKTWCTFAARADVLMLLARTDPDRSLAHRGLSMFVVEKQRGDGHGFVFTQDSEERPAGAGPGRLEGRPIDTLGYRGMHSYELSF